MIRGRGHRPYRTPQLLTGRVDDFPLIPETHRDIAVAIRRQGSRGHANRAPSVDAGQGSRSHGEWRSGDLSSLGDRTRSGDQP